MTLCPSCGLEPANGAPLCYHHTTTHGDDWAVSNRIYCDFFHRKKLMERLAADLRDDAWAHAGDAA